MGNEEPKAVGQGGAALPPPTPEAIRTQLGYIQASPEFQLPERGRAFLRYVVEESLAGRAKRIKAYSIAVEVFGRDEGISPDDPVVRIEAARLRRALERYYLVAGQSDPIRIDIPKGSYGRLHHTSLSPGQVMLGGGDWQVVWAKAGDDHTNGA